MSSRSLRAWSCDALILFIISFLYSLLLMGRLNVVIVKNHLANRIAIGIKNSPVTSMVVFDDISQLTQDTRQFTDIFNKSVATQVDVDFYIIHVHSIFCFDEVLYHNL